MRLQANLQFRKHEAEEMVLHNSATHPASPLAGQIYYGTANIAGPPAYNEKHIRYYDGTLWQELATRAYVDAEIGGISSYSGWLINSADHATVPQEPHTVASGDKIAFVGGTNITVAMANGAVWATKNITINHAEFVPSTSSSSSRTVLNGLTTSNGHVTAYTTITNIVRSSATGTVTDYVPYWSNTTGSLHSTGYIVTKSIAPGMEAPGSDDNLATEKAIIEYVKNHVHGLSGKQSARAASTANINLSNPGTAVFDAVTLTSGQRILVKDQTAPAQNGIYQFNGTSSAMTRTTDADTWNELVSAFIFIEEGTTNGDSGWLCTIDQGGTLDMTAVTWVKFFALTDTTSVNVGTGVKVYVEPTRPFQFRSFTATNTTGAGLSVALGGTGNFHIVYNFDPGEVDLNLFAGTLRATKGGTGVNVYAKGDILFANEAITGVATTPLTKLAIGTSGHILRVSTTGIPEWVAVSSTGITSVTHTIFDVDNTTAGVAAIKAYAARTRGKFYQHANVPTNTNSLITDTLSFDGHFRAMDLYAYRDLAVTQNTTIAGTLEVTGQSTLTGNLLLGTIGAIGVIGTPASWNVLMVNYDGAGPWQVRRMTLGEILEGSHGAEHYVQIISGTSGTVLAEGVPSHGCGTDPIVMLREKSGTNYLDVYGDIHVNASGDVTWSVDTALPADSKIIIMGSKNAK